MQDPRGSHMSQKTLREEFKMHVQQSVWPRLPQQQFAILINIWDLIATNLSTSCNCKNQRQLTLISYLNNVILKYSYIFLFLKGVFTLSLSFLLHIYFFYIQLRINVSIDQNTKAEGWCSKLVNAGRNNVVENIVGKYIYVSLLNIIKDIGC